MELAQIAPFLKKMSNLTELDLSCGKLKVFSGSGTSSLNTHQILTEILEQLSLLKFLNLSNNRLGEGGLRECLEPLSKKSQSRLESLLLKNCGLLEEDLTFLVEIGGGFDPLHGSRAFLSGLKELNLGDNAFVGFHDTLYALLAQLRQVYT